jgi:hypothetical protein
MDNETDKEQLEQEPVPTIEELEDEWAALSCDCGGDFE